MLRILLLFRVLAVGQRSLPFLLNVCEREIKTRCNTPSWILSLKDRVQLCGHTHTHTLPQLFVSHQLRGPCLARSLQSSPRSHNYLPAPSAIFSRGRRGPLHGLITASSDKPLASYINYSTSSTASFVFPLRPPRLLAWSSGNILGNDKQRKRATQKQAATRQTTE